MSYTQTAGNYCAEVDRPVDRDITPRQQGQRVCPRGCDGLAAADVDRGEIEDCDAIGDFPGKLPLPGPLRVGMGPLVSIVYIPGAVGNAPSERKSKGFKGARSLRSSSSSKSGLDEGRLRRAALLVDLLRRDNNDIGVTSQRPCSPPRASQ